MRVPTGVRAGFWYPGPHLYCPPMEKWKEAFKPIATYNGPDLGDPVIGTRFHQKLIEGTLEFSVGVLFRPDRGRHQKLEVILVLHNYIPEMFDYADWEKCDLSANSI